MVRGERDKISKMGNLLGEKMRVTLLCLADGSSRLDMRTMAKRLWYSTQRCSKAKIGGVCTHHGIMHDPEHSVMVFVFLKAAL